MSGGLLCALILLSLAALGYLAFTDPKRRRVHGMAPASGHRFLWPALLALFGPGLSLMVVGHWSGLMIWAGTMTVLGWIMAATPPALYASILATSAKTWSDARLLLARLNGQLRTGAGRGRGLLERMDLRPQKQADNSRTAALEARIAALEARLTLVEGRVSDVATDIQATPARSGTPTSKKQEQSAPR